MDKKTIRVDLTMEQYDGLVKAKGSRKMAAVIRRAIKAWVNERGFEFPLNNPPHVSIVNKADAIERKMNRKS